VANYIALIRKDPGSDFGVEFPDFPGCVSARRDLDEARRMAAEALALHIQGMLEDGVPLPSPSSLDTIMNDTANRDAVAFLVDSVGAPPRGVRLIVILPEDLVREIDRTTRNRSRFLAEAAREKLRQSA